MLCIHLQCVLDFAEYTGHNSSMCISCIRTLYLYRSKLLPKLLEWITEFFELNKLQWDDKKILPLHFLMETANQTKNCKYVQDSKLTQDARMVRKFILLNLCLKDFEIFECNIDKYDFKTSVMYDVMKRNIVNYSAELQKICLQKEIVELIKYYL
jgi:hypothetical protein